MPILRCGQCAHTSEIVAHTPGTPAPCPSCNAQGQTYDTTLFIRKVLQQYGALQQELKRLRASLPEVADAATTARQAPSLSEIDLHNTSALADSSQHAPIIEWFRQRKIQARPTPQAVDTSGFFDEIAVEIGDNYGLLSDVIDKIRWGQKKDVPNFSLKLGDLSQKDGQAINAFCKRLYEHTFLAKYFYQKQEKIGRATIQSASSVRSFFAGEWLEWYALMKTLTLLQERKHVAACTRNLNLVFENEDLHELDVFLLIDGKTPICIECKSGEFRQDIDKYLKLRKRLGIERSQFILFSPDLSEEQAAGLSGMYELTFANQERLVSHLSSLL
ncbi:DUF1887 family protein [Pseudomonas sp. GCM10022188]|uniref:DUF1887 family protein n=1 Tax=Pseudomonas TaxID=286 RepID=UPI001E5893BE|nr:DUF1887 family protein [Pseudomonas oryzagri]MCC6076794.1 DUF1887 family protein [Pseudomonas oryzagri]